MIILLLIITMPDYGYSPYLWCLELVLSSFAAYYEGMNSSYKDIVNEHVIINVDNMWQHHHPATGVFLKRS